MSSSCGVCFSACRRRRIQWIHLSQAEAQGIPLESGERMEARR